VGHRPRERCHFCWEASANHGAHRCGRKFRTPFRAARICPSCERPIEAGETLLIQPPAGSGRRRSANAKRVKRVVSGGLPELGKKR
jgi:hypothetical protein